MAETLGSLVDKLSIKNLRIWHLDELIETLPEADPKQVELRAKRELVERQCEDLKHEIDGFLSLALAGTVRIRDEKIKLYQNQNVKPSDAIRDLGQAVSELSVRNVRLWHLEDEVRRSGISDGDVVRVKRQIDTANQERNDLMDKVDEILARLLDGKKT
ncbi:MAG: hypothetical protein COV67_09700 [Nitrospinae bacterium CG11_big_fil_rev_8_21_14_0_20_56_8]|nr:MAG: hypothetical protein COV67_09700 [Nitrospinae bacterium CG11_big_fil_rev_8_21_14_0_20_56_8]